MEKFILIAEDEDDIREMYAMAFLSRGFQVLEAKNGREFLKTLEANNENINLILLDLIMPVMDGFEALEHVKNDSRFNKIPLIVSTNLDNREDREQITELGASDYLVKDHHTPSELVDKVIAFLESDEHNRIR